MLVMVVDRMLRGGWLEFLGAIEFSQVEAFSQDAEADRCNNKALKLREEAERLRELEAVEPKVASQEPAHAQEANTRDESGGSPEVCCACAMCTS